MKRGAVGRVGERRARQFLESAGLTILDANWRSPEGEIDIIAAEGDVLVFVEVKTRRGLRFGSPEESITRGKRRRLQRAALAYLQSHERIDSLWRIDVITILGDPRQSQARLEHLVDAVEADESSLW
ncbi:MAG: YraN family protein [Gammaproteobacteria bacterium RBG_16_66_13]|nr:MAG: YraN family protein [Gammaproteobacteria bacterium RBG_16_66_13]